MAQVPCSIQGSVKDASGTPVYGALIALEDANANRHTTVSDGDGLFQLSSLPPGNYSVRISASGFSDWTASNIPVPPTPESKPLAAVLEVAPQATVVTVAPEPDEIATVQVEQQVKQRALGVLPNFYVSYEPHPAPLRPKQKFYLAWKLLLDPTTFLTAGTVAGIQQAHNSYHEWGQGSEAFGKRFAAAYGTAAQGLFITSVLADSVLHQDPRYFYSGTGSKKQRAWYAFASAFRTKGDNGKWQPPYAGLLGAVASAELANLYYPGSRTQYSLLGRSLTFHFAGLVAVNMFQEFALKGLTKHRPMSQSDRNATVLRAGTPVHLIAMEQFSKEEAQTGRTLTFVLEDDLTVDGKVLAKTGDVATGMVAQVSPSPVPDEAMSVTLQSAALRAGNVDVPLRSNQVRGAATPMQYKELPESGKVEVTLFVAADVQFPEDR